MTQDAPIRDAATVVVIRDPAKAPRILMGQRGSAAAFMPSKFVFPGGAVDDTDHDIPALSEPGENDLERLAKDHDLRRPARAFALAAIRELWEETGLRLGRPGQPDAPLPADWRGFAAAGLLPDLAPLHFCFRAITPPGRPRRFDARFFAVDAAHIHGDPDDFSEATEELSCLQWVPLDQVREFDLPFVTQVVLAELAEALPRIGPPPFVPFYEQRGATSRMIAL